VSSDSIFILTTRTMFTAQLANDGPTPIHDCWNNTHTVTSHRRFSKRIKKQSSRHHFTVPQQKGYFGTKSKVYQATAEFNNYATSFRTFPPNIIVIWQMCNNFSLSQSASCHMDLILYWR
jgi:hypothetical protein